MMKSTVSMEDLQTFGRYHNFINSSVGSMISTEAAPEAYLVDDEEHHLGDSGGSGYYADGMERTLTDEQIAIFRHSELQNILKRIIAGELEVSLPETSAESASSASKQLDNRAPKAETLEDQSELIYHTPPKITNKFVPRSVSQQKRPAPTDSPPRSVSRLSPPLSESSRPEPAPKKKRNSARWQKFKKRKTVDQTPSYDVRHDPTDFQDDNDGDGRTFRRQARELDIISDDKIGVEMDYD